MRTHLTVLALLPFAMARLGAQSPPAKLEIPQDCRKILEQISKEESEVRRNAALSNAIDPRRSPACFAALILEQPSVKLPSFSRFVKKLEA